jgi:AraC-like DNA-binding protein
MLLSGIMTKYNNLLISAPDRKFMGLIASLPEIDKIAQSVFIMHEKSEKMIPLHTHTKGQLSYVEGGLAYIIVNQKTYVVPARHFFWIPKKIPHSLRLGHAATVLRSLYFYFYDDNQDPFYSKLGIYPATELLIQMINFTERWDGLHIKRGDPDFVFFITLKRLLPQAGLQSLMLSLPLTEDERMKKILKYMEANIANPITSVKVSAYFGMSERSMSRFFQAMLGISFLQYLKTMRMIKAIELLLKTRDSIGEISYMVGYSSIGAFSNAFHSFTGFWPSNLRRI